MNSERFQGKSVIVTGASSGIGKATALKFAQSGANVVVADVSEKGGQETLSMIQEGEGNGLFVKCNVSQSHDVQNLVEETVNRFGKIDAVFNNAGIEGQMGNTLECTEENFDKVISVNLKGVWLCMKYELEQMLKQGFGSIVNCSSVAGLIGFQGLPAYVASKHGVIGLTKTASLEFAQKNIRVNAVCPGAIMTPMLERVGGGSEQDAEKQFSPLEPMGRVGKPEEIANAVLWLCSDQASFVTGQALAVDGGWVAQ